MPLIPAHMQPEFAIGIVADDLTGAMDTAGAFASRGFDTTVVVSSEAPADGYDSRVLCFNTHSRNLPAHGAAEQVGRATNLLMKLGYNRLYKKIDSTMRGQVGAELIAIRNVSGARYAFVCPAFPLTGRTVRQGKLYVGDSPVASTPAGLDALNQVDTASIIQLLKHQTYEEVGLVPLSAVEEGRSAVLDRVKELISAGVYIIVFDAVYNRHLHLITETILSEYPDDLLVGSAGLASALAGAMSDGAESDTQTAKAAAGEGQVLIVAGSINPVTRGQLDYTISHSDVSLVTMAVSNIARSRDASRQEQTIVIQNSLEALGTGHDVALAWNDPDDIRLLLVGGKNALTEIAELEQFLQTTVRIIVEEHPVRGLVLTGGDTAYSVLTALGATAISVHGEMEPGVPNGTIGGGVADGIPIVTKAGGFGDDTTLTRALNSIATPLSDR